MDFSFDELENAPGRREWNNSLPVHINPTVFALTPLKNNKLYQGEVDFKYLADNKQDLEEQGTDYLSQYSNVRDVVEKTNNSFTNMDILTMVPEGTLRDWRRQGKEDDEIVLDFLKERAAMQQDFESKSGKLKPGDLPYNNLRPHLDEVDHTKKLLLVKNIDIAERMSRDGYKTSSRNLSKTLLEHVQETGVDPRYHIRLFMNRVDCDLAQGNMTREVETELLMVLKEYDRFMGTGGAFHKQTSSTLQAKSKHIIELEMKHLQLRMISKLVEMYAIQGRFNTALNTLETLIEPKPWYAPLLQAYRALLFASVGKHEEAVLTLDEAKQALPKHRTVFQRDFRIISAAVEHITKTTEVNDVIKYYVNKITNKRTSIVSDALITGLEYDRVNLQIYSSFIAQFLILQRKYRDALKYNNLALKSCENNGKLTEDVPLLLVQKAEIHSAMGDNSTAKRVYQTAIDLSKLHVTDGKGVDMFAILTSYQNFIRQHGTAAEGQDVKQQLDELSKRFGLLNPRKPSFVETFIALSANPRQHADEGAVGEEKEKEAEVETEPEEIEKSE